MALAPPSFPVCVPQDADTDAMTIGDHVRDLMRLEPIYFLALNRFGGVEIVRFDSAWLHIHKADARASAGRCRWRLIA